MREGRLSILFSAVLQGGLGEVKDIMIQNIERVLERGEKLDLLVDKTDSGRLSSVSVSPLISMLPSLSA
jgi:hypothetical protein